MSFNSRAAPLADAVPVVPSDTVSFNPLPQEIYVGTGGDVALVGSGPFGQPVIFKNVPSGTTLKIAALQVRATGTTASNILALYSALAYRPRYDPPTPALPVGIPDPDLPSAPSFPFNVLTFNGEPLTFGGQIITFGI